jgi:hypothetical protein
MSFFSNNPNTNPNMEEEDWDKELGIDTMAEKKLSLRSTGSTLESASDRVSVFFVKHHLLVFVSKRVNTIIVRVIVKTMDRFIQ